MLGSNSWQEKPPAASRAYAVLGIGERPTGATGLHPRSPVHEQAMLPSGSHGGSAPSGEHGADAGVLPPPECPKSDDDLHCNCWYDEKACCRCGVE